MDIERALVSKIVSTGQLEDAMAKGVRADLFADDEAREVFAYIVNHARKYKSTPSMAACREDKPDFDWSVIQDPLAYLVDKFLGLAKRRLAQDMLYELAEITRDPDKGDDIDIHFLEVSRKLAMLVPSSEVWRFVKDMPKLIEEQKQRQKDGKMSGIPFGFPYLDKRTHGIEPHEFITVAGFSGFGKSTFVKAVAFNVFALGFTPLIVTLEEERKHVAAQLAAMAAAVDLTKMKQLQLGLDDFKHWEEWAAKLAEGTADIPIIDNLRHASPDAIFAETVRYKPDLVIVDYISLMRSGRPSQRGMSMWQSITEITQDLKQNARTLGIPILAAAQTNRAGGRDGAELDNIGHSISIIQDSDKAIGLFADDAMREHNQIEIRINKNRRGPLGKFKAMWDHDSQIFRELQGQDLFKRMREEMT